MSTKRVHEIAKDLKAQGIELDNKEVVAELQSLGYNVRSHSSTLTDDEATAAVQQIFKKYQGKQGSPRAGASGSFVVRRTVGPAAGSTAPTAGRAQVAASTRPPPSDHGPHAPQKVDKTALLRVQRQRAGSRPSAGTGRQPSHLLVDASNICLFRGDARLVLLYNALESLRTRFPLAKPRVIIDASLRHRFRKGSKDRRDLEAKIRSGEWEQVAAGQQADKVLLMYMKKYPDAWVISNDQFKDAVTAPPDLAQRHLRFHVDPQDLEVVLLEA